MKTNHWLPLLLGLGLSVLSGCGRPFDVKTADSFAELSGQSDVGFNYRAMTPEGVAVSITVIDDRERAELGFWIKALKLKLIEQEGYALLSEAPILDKNGNKGHQLVLAREEDKKKFDYRVSIYLAQGRIFLVESGGPHEAFEQAKAGVESIEKSVAVRCPSWLSPVLASRTCNRW